MNLIDMLEEAVRKLASLLIGRPTNFSWFRPFLAASGFPYGNVALNWLRRQGIEVILSLVENPPVYEGFQSLHLPLENRAPAKPEDLCIAVNYLLAAKRAREKVLVHCAAGKGRTGMVLACYLIAGEGYDAGSAIREVREKRPGSLTLEGQVRSVRNFKEFIEKDVFVIVLAAGMSTRYGKNKLLEIIDGRPLIRGVAEAVIRAGLKPVVVVGHEKEKVLDVLKGLEFESVENRNYKEGMSTSVKAGVAHVKERARALMVLPGDVAFIKPEQIRAVLEEYSKTKAPIVIPTYKGRGGHPILFDKSLFGELLQITEEGRGLKSVVKKHEKRVHWIEVGTARILVDIDTQEDLSKRVKELEG
jgi:molybdenum cofactor cytidylyltransferase